MGENRRSSRMNPDDIAAYDQRTLGFYAAEAPAYAVRGKAGVNRHLHAFLDRLRPGARILELGCGGGNDCAAMLERGFDVDPTDGVPEMALRAQARLGIPVRAMRFDELDADGLYDAVWASASLLHVPRKKLTSVLGRIWTALRPGGLHYASYKSGGVEGRDRLGRYFNYLTLEEARSAYVASGQWSLRWTEELMGEGYDGGTGPWVAIIAQRP
jgi:SAM-dependent methyltransferase